MPLITLKFSVYGDDIDEILTEAHDAIFSMTSKAFDFSMQSQYEIVVEESQYGPDDHSITRKKLMASLTVRIKHG